MEIGRVIKGSCHCGAVSYDFKDQVKAATKCNCSICRRLGVLWIYSEAKNIEIRAKPNATLRYIHGDKMIAFHSCKTCGCTTHWENLTDKGGRMAVNLLLANPALLGDIKTRPFDGADTGKFLD